MIVLDTNVVSELMRPHADTSVMDWVDRQHAGDLWLTAVTLADSSTGLAGCLTVAARQIWPPGSTPWSQKTSTIELRHSTQRLHRTMRISS